MGLGDVICVRLTRQLKGQHEELCHGCHPGKHLPKQPGKHRGARIYGKK